MHHMFFVDLTVMPYELKHWITTEHLTPQLYNSIYFIDVL